MKQRHANVQNPLGPTGGPSDLERHEPHAQLRVVVVGPDRSRDKIADEDADGADVDVLKPMQGVDLDHNGGGILMQEVLVHPEHELVVPGRVVVALRVHPG